jgi:hypothetical protein
MCEEEKEEVMETSLVAGEAARQAEEWIAATATAAAVIRDPPPVVVVHVFCTTARFPEDLSSADAYRLDCCKAVDAAALESRRNPNAAIKARCMGFQPNKALPTRTPTTEEGRQVGLVAERH